MYNEEIAEETAHFLVAGDSTEPLNSLQIHMKAAMMQCIKEYCEHLQNIEEEV